MWLNGIKNPVGFTSIPVLFVTVIVYLGLFIPLLYVHHVVPSAPAETSPYKGVNVTEAWLDLQTLTQSFHPYLSKKNDEVRDWLLQRIESILDENGVNFSDSDAIYGASHRAVRKNITAGRVTVINDRVSNISALINPATGVSTYFEGSNIIVYIRGSDDGSSDWWKTSRDNAQDRAEHPRGVLVNAHFDSVSTGYGATDDGVGIVSLLQLLRYYIAPGNTPRRGIVLLLNNGEEDYLHGARAFMQHPISQFPDTFVNLEGAGAGGRALMFRATDDVVTSFYKKSPHPFGTSLSSDVFKSGAVASQTDYIVFDGDLKMRGLDIAFMAPRFRYHTQEDSTRFTSKDSLWHMLSATIETSRGMSSTSGNYISSNKGSDAVWFDMFGSTFGLLALPNMIAMSIAFLVLCPIAVLVLLSMIHSAQKWYPFTRVYKTDPLDPHLPDDEASIALDGWRGFFRYPLAFVIASVATFALALLTSKVNAQIIQSSPYSVWSMCLSAWLVVAWVVLRGADVTRPSALHRLYTFLWLFLGAWVFLVLATIAENNFGLAGVYPLVICFAAVFACCMTSLAELLSLPRKEEFVRHAAQQLAQSQAPGRQERTPSVGSNQLLSSDHAGASSRPHSSSGTGVIIRHHHVVDGPSGATIEEEDEHADLQPSEITALLGGGKRKGGIWGKGREHDRSPIPGSSRAHATLLKAPYGDEQAWSGNLPSWLWILQFLLIAPISIVLFGQIGLVLTSALPQTLSDSDKPTTVYLAIAGLSIFLVNPLSPFLHRLPKVVPFVALVALIGTSIYNLVAFPFGAENRFKFFFQQTLDIETGVNRVVLTGLKGYMQSVVASLPSTAGKEVSCVAASDLRRKGLIDCSWTGLAPHVVANQLPHVPPQQAYRDWIKTNVSYHDVPNPTNTTWSRARVSIKGRDSRGCRLVFPKEGPRVRDYNVRGSSTREPLDKIGADGVQQLRLWKRDWNQTWTVDLYWDSFAHSNNSSFSIDKVSGRGKGASRSSNGSRNVSVGENKEERYRIESDSVNGDGGNDDEDGEGGKRGKNDGKGIDIRVQCLYADANIIGTIPALDEVKQYAPVWSIVTKLEDGLVVAETTLLL